MEYLPSILQAPSLGTHEIRKVILMLGVSRRNCEDYHYIGALGWSLGKEDRDIIEVNDEANRAFYSWGRRGQETGGYWERPTPSNGFLFYQKLSA